MKVGCWMETLLRGRCVKSMTTGGMKKLQREVGVCGKGCMSQVRFS